MVLNVDFILLVKLLFLFEKRGKKGEEIGKFEVLLLWGNTSEP